MKTSTPSPRSIPPSAWIQAALIASAATSACAQSDPSPAKSEAGTTNQMPAVLIRAQDPVDYAAPSASTATRSDTPLLRTPMAVQVVPRSVIQDRQALTIEEALRNVSGVQAPPAGYYDNFLIRGFDSYGDVFRNGLKLSGIIGAEDMAFVDHVEIAKGPTAMLYGRVQPGGLVNIVTRKPEANAAYSIDQQVGSWGTWRTVADATGRVNTNGTVLYRLMGVYDRGDSFIDFQHHDNKAIAAYLSWIPSERFSANFQFEYYDQRTANPGYTSQMVPYVGGRPADLPRHWTQSDPAMWDLWPNTVGRATFALDWNYALSDEWKLTQRSHFFTSDELQSYLLYKEFDEPTGILHRSIAYNPVDRNQYANNLDLSGRFDTWQLEHKVLLGVDWYDYREKFTGYNEGGGPLDRIPALDIYHPVYGDIDVAAMQSYINASKGNVLWRSHGADLGVYLQDQMTIAERVDVLVGGRYDFARDRYSSTYGTTDTPDYPNNNGAMAPAPMDRELSPRAGILYRLTDRASVYGSYSKSFGLANGFNTSGQALPPEKGEQFEAGVKASWMEGQLSTTATVFDLTKQNVVEYDLAAHPVVVGEVRSRGLELDVTGQITRNLAVIGSYTYDRAVITDDPFNGNEGHRFTGVAASVGSLWLRYDTAPGEATGWRVGAGVFISGQRPGDDANTQTVPGYERLDAMVGYRMRVGRRRLSCQVNVQNLTDKRYFDNSAYGYAIFGTPLAATGSVRLEF